MTPPSPVGIEIPFGKKKWKVGRVLGKGACAIVCSLDYQGKETDFAVKLAPLPVKTTKKGNSVEETNAKLLYYENLLYRSHFQALQGKCIPMVPQSSAQGPPSYGEVNGYRYFVMEKMDSTVSSVVPLILNSKSTSKTVNFGVIACALLSCVQACHEAKNLHRDVKTENFMLTIDKRRGLLDENKLSSRIRLIDLAIATQCTPTYFETDEASLVGTPLYASLNVHSGKKAGFRDDLESLGYVIAELLIQLTSGDSSKQLPWNNGKSDDEIWSIKKTLVENKNSTFYAQLGNHKTREIFSSYMDTVRGYRFKSTPNYVALSKILSKLALPIGINMSASSRRTRSRTSSRKKVAPAVKGETASPMKRRRRANNAEEYDDNNMSDNETVYLDAVEEMDWEYIADENKEPEAKSKNSARSNQVIKRRHQRTVKPVQNIGEVITVDDDDDELKPPNARTNRLKRRGVRIFISEGPHKGEFFDLEAGVNETLIIGCNPVSKVGKVIKLKRDDALHKTHLRLDFDANNRKMTAIKVTDKSKANGKTFVNRTSVKNFTKAFINDIIKIGNTTLKVQKI